MFPRLQEKLGMPKLEQVYDVRHGYGEHPDMVDQHQKHGIGAMVETVFIKEGALTPEARQLISGDDREGEGAAQPLVYVSKQGDMAVFRDVAAERPDLAAEAQLSQEYIDALRDGRPTADGVHFSGAPFAIRNGKLADYVAVSHKHHGGAEPPHWHADEHVEPPSVGRMMPM